MHKKSLEAAAHLETVEGEELSNIDEDHKKKRLIDKCFENIKQKDQFSEDETLKCNTTFNQQRNEIGTGIKNEIIRTSPIVQKITASLACNPHLQTINHVGYQFHYNS